MSTIEQLLKNNSYPGRGIVLGRSADGSRAYLAYFIMGRSANSRNRVFVETADGIVALAADASKVEDPSLIHYTPVRCIGNTVIVTNGDQTDTIYAYLSRKNTFEEALRTRTFEPDAPNFTPRISGLLRYSDTGFSYKLSILKTPDGKAVQRFFWEYPAPRAGVGHFLHTYQQDANPLPSFYGEPVEVPIAADFDAFSDGIWESLHEENKISLYTKCISQEGEEKTKLYNKYAVSE